MLSLWNIFLFSLHVSHLSLHVTALTGEKTEETRQLDADTTVKQLTQPSQRPHGSGLASVDPMFGRENVNFLSLPLSWSSSSSEESDRQGVIGEYADLQETTETSLLYPNEKALISSPTESATEDVASRGNTQPLRSSSERVPPHPTQDQILKYQSAGTSAASVLYSAQTVEDQPVFSASQDETTEKHLPFLLPGPLPSNSLEQDSASPLSVGSWSSPKNITPPVATGKWEWTTGSPFTTQGERTVPLKETGDRAATMEADKGEPPSLTKFKYIQLQFTT